MATLRFLGAAGTVTGSKYALDTGKHKLLIDCGLFQGLREIRERNWEPFPEAVSSFSAAVLTHAHIDHSGYLPCLYRQGYRKPVYCTPATADLCKLLLPDSARLQKEESDYRNEKGLTRHHPALPLYNEDDAWGCLELFQTVPYGTWFSPVSGVRARYHDAGHILGSAWIELEVGNTRLLVSGDLGRSGVPILRDPEPPTPCDWMVLESTYGDRAHSDEPVGPQLAEAVHDTVQKRGVLVIPAFAVERAQELIYLFGELWDQRAISRIPLFLDSPMAAGALKLFDRYVRDADDAARQKAHVRGSMLDYPRLTICETVADSKRISRTPPPYIVIAGSGMATGGRVLHHLRRCLPDPNNTVLLVGYQAEGTRGRSLEEGAESVRIFKEDVPVRAAVRKLDGFSGHADFRQINRWLKTLEQAPRNIYLVHGEAAALESQRERIESWPGWHAHVPVPLETVTLDD